MNWIIDTLSLYFEYVQVTLASPEVEPLDIPVFTFKFVETSCQKTGDYKQIKGMVYANMGNHQGLKERWTTIQRNLLRSCLPIGNEIQDIKTGFVTFEIDVIINNNIE